MLQADYDSKYADIMERCFYNSILSGMAEDGKSFFYVNPLEVNPKACKEDSRKTILSLFVKKWFDCACCPPNLARIISDYGEYCFTETESTLFVNLYQGTKLETDKADIEIVSDYLQSGKFSFKIKQKDLLKLPFVFHTGAVILNLTEKSIHQKGYAYFDIENDAEITAEFNPEIKMIKCNSNVRENIGKIAVTRGPIVYCLEEKDNGKNLHLLRLSKHPKFIFDGEFLTANGYKRRNCIKNSILNIRSLQKRLFDLNSFPIINGQTEAKMK